MADEVVLPGGTVSDVWRVGETVRRSQRRWSAAVQGLLVHLEGAGFAGAPRFLGVDERGREILSWIDGEPATRPWPRELRTDVGLRDLAALLRAFHEAVKDYLPPPDAEWFIGPRPLGANEIICHGDIGTWNVIWRDDKPVAFIDWDFAEPGDPLMDLGELAFFAVPMRDNDNCRDCGFEEIPDRARRLAMFCESYGAVEPKDVVDAAEENWLSDIARIREFGPQGLLPWDGFMNRGIDRGGEQLIAWLRENRHRLISG